MNRIERAAERGRDIVTVASREARAAFPGADGYYGRLAYQASMIRGSLDFWTSPDDGTDAELAAFVRALVAALDDPANRLNGGADDDGAAGGAAS